MMIEEFEGKPQKGFRNIQDLQQLLREKGVESTEGIWIYVSIPKK